jgi:hypothetical protein
MEDNDFLDDVAGFKPAKGRAKPGRAKPDLKTAREAGFENRAPKPVREETKPLPIRIKASELRRFRQQALNEFGEESPYGALVSYFRKIWKEHEKKAGY